MSERGLEADRALSFFDFFFFFFTGFCLSVSCLPPVRAVRFRRMCGHLLWSDGVLGFYRMNLRFTDSQNISVPRHIEHLLVW